MDELVFDNNDRIDSPSVQKSKLTQNAPGQNAFKDFQSRIKSDETGSPNRKHIINKKNQEKAGGGFKSSSQSATSSAINNGKAAVSELSPQALSKNKDLQTNNQVKGTPGASSALSDVKDLGVVGGKKRTDQTESQNGINLNSQKEDSFQKLYSKELDLDEDEVPIILHELNDSAIHFISHEQYERSLSLLQKAQTLLDRLKFQKNPKDRFLIQVTMHNMALCFQKMGALEECALCLDACLHQINSQYLAPIFSQKPTKKLKKLKYECKIHMQVCALLSQLHRHEEALLHAKQAVQISQYLVNDLVSLCELNVEKTIVAKKKEQEVHEEQERQKFEHGMSMSHNSSQADLIYYDHSISMLERTALRVFPIIKEIQNRMVKHKDVPGGLDAAQKQEASTNDNEKAADRELFMNDNQSLNMKVLLGYLNQSEWLYLLNIGNIMQITPLTIHDLYSNQKIDVELSRDSILEKITFLAISYFCVSTELRFLVSSKEKLSFDPVYVKAESEFWHGKALEISCGFLPSESPLVTHILSSYQKHHAPVQQAIPENEEEEQGLRVIRPEKGIDKSQFQPIIRLNKHLNIALSPLRLSPNNHRNQAALKGQSKNNNVLIKPKVEVKEVSVSANLIVDQQQAVKIDRVQPMDQPQQFNDEEAMLLQVLQNHPSQRSIEFSSSNQQNKPQQDAMATNAIETNGVDFKNGGKVQQMMHGGPDLVEYELESYDQSVEPSSENNNTGPSGNQRPPPIPVQRAALQQQQQIQQRDAFDQSQRNQSQQQQQQQQQHLQHGNQVSSTQAMTSTPSRVVDQSSSSSKTQMAVPSPNALASAMQREQRESLTQLRVTETRSHSTQVLNTQQQAKVVGNEHHHHHQPIKKVVHTQRLATKNEVVGISQLAQQQDKQSSSFQVLPGSGNNLTDHDIIPTNLRNQRSIDEDALIQLANEGMLANHHDNHNHNHNNLNNRFDPLLDHGKPKRPNKQLQEEQRDSTRFDPHKARPQPASKEQRNKHSSRGQQNQASTLGQKFKTTTSNEHHKSDSADERTPTAIQQQSSARLSGSNNLGQSQRSRSKGKTHISGAHQGSSNGVNHSKKQKAGVMTQPQTHQNSANTTAYEPLRQAFQSKEISHFNGGGNDTRKQPQRDGRTTANSLEGCEDDHSAPTKSSRPSQKGYTKNGGLAQKNNAGGGGGRATVNTSSLENRENATVVVKPLNTKSGSQLQVSGDGAVQRPDSRRMIGGKRRQINKEQKSSDAVRSNSAGRRNQNQTLQMQGGYKTNDQSMTSASSHVQFNMNGQPLMHTNANPQHQVVNANNFKTFQQTRKAVTAHSTQASNSPRKPLPSAKFSDSTNNVNRMSKQGHVSGAVIQDPVFMNSHNQLNQSRSTIENNNSSMIDRSMNDQLMLNNSSFEVVNAQSRSRSFAKTNALSQQNSRDVIVGSKKKNVGQHPSQQPVPSSKSQNKKTTNKEMLNYLNQGSTSNQTTQKNMNTLLSAAQQQQNMSKYNTQSASAVGHQTQIIGRGGGEDVDYRKQMLIKQALDMQQQNKDSRQKSSGQKGTTSTSGRTQMAFQQHASSVQMPLNHTNSVQTKSHSSQGMRKSSQGITKENTGQSQKALNNSTTSQSVSQQQIAQLDPQAIAALSQALNLKGGQGNHQNNAQLLYNQILQFQQHQNQQQPNQPPSSKKQNQTHNMIKKFLKDRATPQPTSQSNQSINNNNNPQPILVSQNLQPSSSVGQRQGVGGHHSHSPNPMQQSRSNVNNMMVNSSHSTTLIDNFTTAPFLMQNSATQGVPQSKQAHTTKASAEQNKSRTNVANQFTSSSSSSQQQKMYSSKQSNNNNNNNLLQAQSHPNHQQQQQQQMVNPAKMQQQNNSNNNNPGNSSSSYGYNTEHHQAMHHQHITGPGRKNAQERFNDKSKQASSENGQQREPTPVFHHKPYQKPEDPIEADNLAQYPMQPQQYHKGGNAAKTNKQLAAMYKSIKGEK